MKTKLISALFLTMIASVCIGQNFELSSVAKFGTFDNLLLHKIKQTDIDISIQEVNGVKVIPGAITGAFLISELRSAANGIVNHMQNAAPAVGSAISADLLLLSNQLASQISDLSKPINELNSTIQQLAQRALVAVDQTKHFITATQRCLKYDLQFLVAGLQSAVHEIIASAVPWSKKYPVMTRIYQLGSNTPHGIRVGASNTLIIEGYNFFAKEKKGGVQIRVFKSGSPNDTLNASIQSYDRNRIIAFIDTAKQTGQYVCEITFNRTKCLGLGKKQVKITNLIVVIPIQEFKIKYEVLPTCIVYPTIDFYAGRVDGINDQCDGDRIFGGNYIMPEPWEYTGFTFIERSNNGCNLINYRYLGGNSVQVQFRCPERGGIFCTGTRKWIQGEVRIFGKKTEIQSGTLIRDEYPRPLSYNQTVEVLSLPGNPCQVDGWTVTVTIVYPDGSEHTIPAVSGTGDISGSNQEGAAFYWNSSIRKLSVTTPTYDCGL